jgi:hypothetical protein
MPAGVRTTLEKNLYKITYPTGTVKYRVEFFGKAPLYELVDSLEEARKIKAKHLKDNPQIVPMDAEAAKLSAREKAATKKVSGTKFIEEFKTRPGTYNIRIARAPNFKDKKIVLSETVKGLANAKKKEKELITKMEGLIGRSIDESVSKPVNPNIKKAFDEVSKDMKKWNKLGYYPDDILVKASNKFNLPYNKKEGANNQLIKLVRDEKLIDRKNLQSVTPKYLNLIEDYKNFKGDKSKPGTKKQILENADMPSKATNISAFREVLKKIPNVHVTENIKLPDEQVQRTITNKLRKVSALNMEEYLSGKKMGDLEITGKTGSLLDKMHLGDKTGLVRIGEMGYGSSQLNQLLGGGFKRAEGAERHRTALNKHINKIVEKYRGNPNGMYQISAGPDSFDQKKFKLALEKEFGKSKGPVPLKQYIDKIINTEVQLMGYATDGLITARRLDPITLERMAPSSNLSGSRTIPDVGKMSSDMTLQELGLQKQKAGFKKVTPLLRDVNEAANIAFQTSELNIKKMKLSPARMNAIVGSIDKMLAGGLQNQKYEAISKLAKQCTLLRADGGRIAFAEGGPCAQAQKAVRTLDNSDMVKIGSNIDDAMQGPMGKIRDVSKSLIQSPMLRGAGKFGAIAAGGAVAAGFVKQFMNDDPTTYLSNEEQQKNLLIDMVTGSLDDTPEQSPAIGDAYLPALGAATVAGTAAVAPSTIDAVRGGALGAKKSGITKTALKTLGKGLSATASPLGLLATEPLYLAEQIQQGDSLGEIATNPFNYAGLAFTGPATEFATKGGLNPTIAKTMRLGISPNVLKTVSRRFGLPGLALSLGISGYEMFDDYRNKRGMFSEE